MDVISEETPLPSKAQVQKLIDKLLPRNEEMDTSSALLIIERSGADRDIFTENLKLRLERKVLELGAQGRDGINFNSPKRRVLLTPHVGPA
ncbi:MAG TPA: hypothetical protein DC047_06105 [Blastocatellia bacterium]|nr:hypothetical protein [Blastocatellia bacterium]